ncbi:MAG: hypothetical protein II859_08015 [Bacteroidales bacterium]|nr:hypothetical protein [Bacteroidales bacterium]
MKKPTLTILLLCLFTLGSFAQTPEWTEYCQIRDKINHNDYPPEIAYGMYCRMDSIYNGIPHFTDLYNFLSIAVACNEQEKTKELALFPLLRLYMVIFPPSLTIVSFRFQMLIITTE